MSKGQGRSKVHAIEVAGQTQLIACADPWVMAYDLFPLTTIAEREQIYPRCLTEGWMLAFAHDPEHGGVALEGTIERPIVSRTLPL